MGTLKAPAGRRLDMPARWSKKKKKNPSETPYHLNTSQLSGKVDGPTFHGYWCGASGSGEVSVCVCVCVCVWGGGLIQCTMCLTLTDRFP